MDSNTIKTIEDIKKDIAILEACNVKPELKGYECFNYDCPKRNEDCSCSEIVRNTVNSCIGILLGVSIDGSKSIYDNPEQIFDAFSRYY